MEIHGSLEKKPEQILASVGGPLSNVPQIPRDQLLSGPHVAGTLHADSTEATHFLYCRTFH